MPAPTTLDRIQGCLLAGAVGDALGAPVEFLSTAAIRARFAGGLVREIGPSYGRRSGAITDDTQMTLFTAEGLVLAWERGRDRGICDARGMVHEAYLRWLRTQDEAAPAPLPDGPGWLLGEASLWSRRAPGNTCLSALRSGVAGTPEEPINDSKGCGGVMRAAPVGLVGGGDSFRLGCEVAALTHGHPSGWLSAGVLAHAVERVVAGASLLEALDEGRARASEHPGSSEVVRALEHAVDLARDGEPSVGTLERLGLGWVGEEALAIGAYCALACPSLERALELAVSHGGDSDSTGAIAGNLLGAQLGVEAIPRRWLQDLELRDTIEETARRLADCRC